MSFEEWQEMIRRAWGPQQETPVSFFTKGDFMTPFEEWQKFIADHFQEQQPVDFLLNSANDLVRQAGFAIMDKIDMINEVINAL